MADLLFVDAGSFLISAACLTLIDVRDFVATTANAQIVLFASRALHATDTEIGFLYAAGAAGIVVVSLVAGPICS